MNAVHAIVMCYLVTALALLGGKCLGWAENRPRGGTVLQVVIILAFYPVILVAGWFGAFLGIL